MLPGKLGNYTVISTDGTLTVNAAPTANFLFVNNQAATGNSIASYSVAGDDIFTALAGSPVATGGLGANEVRSSVNRLALSAGNNLLFVSNGGDQTISAFPDRSNQRRVDGGGRFTVCFWPHARWVLRNFPQRHA